MCYVTGDTEYLACPRCGDPVKQEYCGLVSCPACSTIMHEEDAVKATVGVT